MMTLWRNKGNAIMCCCLLWGHTPHTATQRASCRI